MFDFLLDETTNDLVITDKDLVFTTTEQESLRQRLSIRLLTYKGEWFLNESYGIPYMQEIIGITRSKKTVDNILLNNAKLELTASDSISKFESSYGVDARNYNLTFDVSTIEGVVKVDINSDPASEYIYPDPIVFNPYAGCGETIGISNTLFDYANISGLPATNPNTGLPNDHTWINNWSDVTPSRLVLLKVAAGAQHSLGLKEDGTVVATGDNTYGQLNISSWSGIIDIAAGTGSDHTVGLKSDGTVVAVGDNTDNECDVISWSGITKISAGGHTVGLKSDGTVVAVGPGNYGQTNVGDWVNITDISAGYRHTIGLKSDGNVVSTGMIDFINPETWVNITKITSGFDNSFGLRSNGTVASAYNIEAYSPSWISTVSSWTDIVDICVGNYFLIGRKSDGTIVLAGGGGDILNVTSWTDIASFDAGGGGWYAGHAVGLKSDGTAVANGENTNGQCDVSSW